MSKSKTNVRAAIADSTRSTLILCGLLALAVPALGLVFSGIPALWQAVHDLWMNWADSPQLRFWAGWSVAFACIVGMVWCFKMSEHAPYSSKCSDVFFALSFVMWLGWLAGLIATGLTFHEVTELSSYQVAAWIALYVPFAVIMGGAASVLAPDTEVIPLWGRSLVCGLFVAVLYLFCALSF
ncbi:TPA: hypothetical protein ACGW3M_000947 [Pseudomonas aeruginosa]|uniref:hypothetical protein n=1 Tax=Pseudomonas aeruginosa TaxID=287 RepID=UPI0027FB92F5|nr:hypothetical protein [Pseudomonas aeruginosa]EKY4113712.1 hypothetical protein [Pseudomonas aeruginosa]ELJ2276234.1 hypothetical protein [Pseudomonas aeruginosa]MBX6653688.1 hypothetical protein [Pseudomonas aeruginosa]MCS8413337.1 hypothetical protein [Pseudomonas aeruginosa]